MTIKETNTFDPVIDRYTFDFRQCTYANGFAQIDTKQDASYYGNWCSPVKRMFVGYCEGDIRIVKCSTDEEFAKFVREFIQWSKDAGYDGAIDPGFDNKMRSDFVGLGLEDLLH